MLGKPCPPARFASALARSRLSLGLRDLRWPHIFRPMSVLRLRAAREGFIHPCLPSRTAHPPLGPGWLHEIKYDGFRLMARRDGRSVRLLTRRGYDWTQRFRLIADAVDSLRCRSCVIDG